MTTETEKTPEDVFAELMGDDVPPTTDAPAETEQATEIVAEATEQAPVAEASDPATNAEIPLPDDVRQKLARLAEVEDNFSKLQRDYQAVHGRLAPMQRKIAEMEQAARSSSEAAPKPPQGQSVSTEQSLQDELKAIEEDYPEIAKAFKRKFQALEQRLEQMGSKFEPVVRQIGHQTEVQHLTQAHPDWREINASEDFHQFVEWWWSNQPPHFQQAIGGDEGLRQAFNRADFTIPLLNQYKTLRRPSPQTATAQTPQRSQPSAQTARRAMSAAPNVRSSGLPPAVDMSKLPEEDQFALLMAQAGVR